MMIYSMSRCAMSVTLTEIDSQELKRWVRAHHAATGRTTPSDNRFTFNNHFYAMLRNSAEKTDGYKMSSSDYAKRFVHPKDMPVVGNGIK